MKMAKMCFTDESVLAHSKIFNNDYQQDLRVLYISFLNNLFGKRYFV